MHFERFQKKYLNFFVIQRNNFCLEVFENEKKKQLTRCCIGAACAVLCHWGGCVWCHATTSPEGMHGREGYWTIHLPLQGACNFDNTLSCGIAPPPPLLCCHLPCRGEKLNKTIQKKVLQWRVSGGCWCCWCSQRHMVGKIIIKQSSCRVKNPEGVGSKWGMASGQRRSTGHKRA